MTRLSLVFTPGLDSDDTRKAAKGTWADADAVRFHNGRPQTMGGFEHVLDAPLTGVCRNVFAWTDASDLLNTAFGTHSALQLFQSGTLYTITPSGLAAGSVDGLGGLGYGVGGFGAGYYSQPSAGDVYPRTWSLSAYGGSLMANPRGGTVYWWQNDPATPAAALANAPARVTAMLVPPNRRQVMCFGCTGVDGVYNPSGIRWSKLQDPTTWSPPDGTTGLASSTAGEDTLEGGGRIVKALAIGDAVIVWTDAAVYRGDYTGDVSRLWSFSKLADHAGLIGPNAAVVTSQTAWWLSPPGQFWTYPLGGVPTPLPCKIQHDFAANISTVQQDKIVAASISGAFEEVVFHYPDARDGLECSRFLLLNTTEGEWSRGMLARSAAIDANPAPFPMAVTPDGMVYYQEKGLSADAGLLSRFLESADLILGQDPVMIREMWPDFRDQQGPVQVFLICRDRPQGPEKTYGPFVCPPGQARICTRITARMARLRIVSNASPSFWRLGEPALEVSPAGSLGRR